MTTSPSRRPRRPRRRTRLSTDQVRSSLYNSALSRFRDQGYDATSVSELTRAAGVAKGTFFNHFPTKEHILASWFRGVWEEEAQALSRQGNGGADAILEQMRRVMSRLEEDAILAGALAARMADLPAGDEESIGPPSSGSASAAASPSVAPRPLDQVRAWIVTRIQECLPVVVPIRPVSDADLSALLAGAMVETLREAFLTGVPGDPIRARSRLETRVEFLLASAGLRLG
jgi:AcrR family transcriptional regulator